jgi:hypothetical protein
MVMDFDCLLKQFRPGFPGKQVITQQVLTCPKHLKMRPTLVNVEVVVLFSSITG